MENSEQSTATPSINVIARRRRVRRMVFAVVLVLVAVIGWAIVSPKFSPLTPGQGTQGSPSAPVAPVKAETAQEALEQLRSETPTMSSANMLDAGVIAAANYHTALGTFDGFIFPGVTTVAGSNAVALVVQQSGSCFVRTVSADGSATAVVNDPHACTAAGQMELKASMS